MASQNPKIQSHIDQWKHNRSLITKIPRGYPDWMLTVAFYAALHAVDALLAFDQSKPAVNHDARNQILIHTNRYQKICSVYLSFYGLSRTVRYMAKPADWTPVDKLEKYVFGPYLYAIENSVQRLMSTDLQLGQIVIPADAGPASAA